MQNLEDRKRQAAKKAGLNPDDEKTQEIMLLRNKSVNQQIFDYLARTQSNLYISLVSDQQLYWEIQFDKMAASERTIKEKIALSKEAKIILDRIEYAFREIFQYDTEITMAKGIVRKLTVEQRVKSQA
jgi:hypothetical protein